ncbi:MAG: hypothetical protein ACRDRF_19415 [Pseudonocardiaceae bacterium]
MPTSAFDDIPVEQLWESQIYLQLACNHTKQPIKGRGAANLCALQKRLLIYARERGITYPEHPIITPRKNGPPIA